MSKIVASFLVHHERIFLDTDALIEMGKGSGNMLADVADGAPTATCEACGEPMSEACLAGMIPDTAPTSPDRADFIVECGNQGCEAWYEVYWRSEK